MLHTSSLLQRFLRCWAFTSAYLACSACVISLTQTTRRGAEGGIIILGARARCWSRDIIAPKRDHLEPLLAMPDPARQCDTVVLYPVTLRRVRLQKTALQHQSLRRYHGKRRVLGLLIEGQGQILPRKLTNAKAPAATPSKHEIERPQFGLLLTQKLRLLSFSFLGKPRPCQGFRPKYFLQRFQCPLHLNARIRSCSK